MEDDLETALCEVSNEAGGSLVSQLLEFQKCAIRQPRSLEWARTLKCLRVVHEVMDEENEDDVITTLQGASIPITGGEYVAVSYRQDETSRRSEDCKSLFTVTSEDGTSLEQSKVNNKTLSRILKYMKALDVPYFWIDQQGIEQEDVVAKDIAVQSMDLVYRCSNHPLGLLTTEIIRQKELDLLHDLISGHLVVDNHSHLECNVRYATARVVLRLLDRLLKDEWWTRRWIFQEEYCSFSHKRSKIMKLLIPHTARLKKRQWDKISQSMSGEVIVSVKHLRTQATLFCRACTSVEMFRRPQELKLLAVVQGRAKSYSIAHNNPRNLYEESHCRPMSVQILSDIHYRQVTEAGDTLAILANCCSYDIRLDVHKLKDQRNTSLSLAILTQWLLNGELIWSKKRGSLNNNILDFLRRQTFDKFDPPTEIMQLTFMKKCRLKNVHLLEEGIHSTGHLWQIVDVLSANTSHLKLEDDLDEDEFKQYFLTHLVDELSKRCYSHLSRHINAYVNGSLPSEIRKHSGLVQIFDQMALNLAKAIANGEELSVAQHVKHKSSWAIFVGNWKPDKHSKHSYIFTASEAAQYEHLVKMKRSPDKYVSLLVNADITNSGGPVLLETEAWINGLVFPGSAKEEDVLFKWPAVLQEKITESEQDDGDDFEEEAEEPSS